MWRRISIALGLILSVIAVAVVIIMAPWHVQRASGPPFYHDSIQRQNYENALLNNPERVDATLGFYVDDKTGEVFTAYITPRGLCRMRCMTAVKVNDGYAITLPVSYSHETGSSQSFKAPFTKEPIVSLTYWDPTSHRPVTITSSSGRTVKLPKVLYDRSVQSVEVGETVYTTPDYIYTISPGHSVVLADDLVWAEPSGALYGTVDLARITRTEEGFTVCLPASYGTLISTPNAPGIPATILKERC